MRCDQLQPSWKPSFLCCSECSCKIGEYAPDLISCSRVCSEHVLGCSFLCSVTRNVHSKTANVSLFMPKWVIPCHINQCWLHHHLRMAQNFFLQILTNYFREIQIFNFLGPLDPILQAAKDKTLFSVYFRF